MVRHAAAAAVLLSLCGVVPSVRAQAPADSARCDSLVAASAVDSVPSALFIWVGQLAGADLDESQQDRIESLIAQMFAAPTPFRLSVFDGPPVIRGLRVGHGRGDSAAVREVSVAGVYRITITAHGGVDELAVVRSSLVRGLDSAMTRAIRAAASTGAALWPGGHDRWRLQIRLGGDSLPGARRLAQGVFPRMPVRDAVALPSNPSPAPDSTQRAAEHGDVVLRFVVDRDGKPALETIEIVRATTLSLARTALESVGALRFTPATIRGCPVAQLVDYPFVFGVAAGAPPSDR